MILHGQHQQTCEPSCRKVLAKAMRGKRQATQDHVRARSGATMWGCDARRGELEEGDGGTTAVRLQ